MRRRILDLAIWLFGIILLLPVLAACALLSRIKRNVTAPKDKPTLLWAGVPVLSLSFASRAMRRAGYRSETIANDRYRTAPDKAFTRQVPWEKRLPFGFNSIVTLIRGSIQLIWTMFTFDIMHSFFNGGILGKTALADYEFWLWKVSGGKLVLMSYGGDAFVYSQLRDQPWLQALEQSYPRTENQDAKVAHRLRRFTSLADCVIGTIVHDLCLPRVDKYAVLWYPGNLEWSPVYPSRTFSDTTPVKIVHATNHRSVKGSDKLIDAVSRLRDEGFNVELDVVENVKRMNTIARLRQADIVVDQLHFAYGLTALEAMCLGKPVITAISDAAMYKTFRKHSYLQEAPIIEADVTTVEDVLRRLLMHPEKFEQLGLQSRAYAEKYHSNAATVALFEEIYSTL